MFNYLKDKLFGGKADQKDGSGKKYVKKQSGGFTLDDFAKQLAMSANMGSMQHMAKKVPGMPKLTPAQIKQGQAELALFNKILKVMTVQQRQESHLLDASAKARIAKSAGVSTKEVDLLLQRFEQSKRFVKLFKRFGKF